MKILTFTAKTNKGKNALKMHWKESQKIPFKQKLVVRASGYKHELISEDPFTLKLTINNKRFTQPDFIKMIKKEAKTSLKKNGADSSDYTIEVS